MLVSRGVPCLKLTFSPMQIDGWKINFPSGMACFQGRALFLGEVDSGGNSGLFFMGTVIPPTWEVKVNIIQVKLRKRHVSQLFGLTVDCAVHSLVLAAIPVGTYRNL